MIESIIIVLTYVSLCQREREQSKCSLFLPPFPSTERAWQKLEKRAYVG